MSENSKRFQSKILIMKIKFPKDIQQLLIKRARNESIEWGYNCQWFENAEKEIELFLVKEIKGTETGIPRSGAFRVIPIHTHHRKLYGDLPYHPPSTLDYITGLGRRVTNKNPFSIVVDLHNFWVYTPNKQFIKSYSTFFDRSFHDYDSKRSHTANSSKTSSVLDLSGTPNEKFEKRMENIVTVASTRLNEDFVFNKTISLDEYIKGMNQDAYYIVHCIPIPKDADYIDEYFLTNLSGITYYSDSVSWMKIPLMETTKFVGDEKNLIFTEPKSFEY